MTSKEVKMESYKIIFQGEIAEGSNKEKTLSLLAKFLKLPESKANQLLNGKSYALKKNISLTKAKQLQEKFLSVGIVTKITQDTVKKEKVTPPAEILKVTDDYEVIVDGTKCCRHCGSNLEAENKATIGISQRVEEKINNLDTASIKTKAQEKKDKIYNDVKELTDKGGIKGLFNSPLGLILSSGFVLLVFLFVGMGSGTPSCSNADVQETVLEIVNRELKKQIFFNSDELLNISLQYIRTTDTNEKTGANACAAEVTFENKQNRALKNSSQITYTVQNIEGEAGFYVNVYGL